MVVTARSNVGPSVFHVSPSQYATRPATGFAVTPAAKMCGPLPASHVAITFADTGASGIAVQKPFSKRRSDVRHGVVAAVPQSSAGVPFSTHTNGPRAEKFDEPAASSNTYFHDVPSRRSTCTGRPVWK